jgi:hypothetical protein
MKTQQITIAPLNLLLGFTLLTTVLITGCGKGPSSNSSHAEPVAARNAIESTDSDTSAAQLEARMQRLKNLAEAAWLIYRDEVALAARGGVESRSAFTRTRTAIKEGLDLYNREATGDMERASAIQSFYNVALRKNRREVESIIEGGTNADRKALLENIDRLEEECFQNYETSFTRVVTANPLLVDSHGFLASPNGKMVVMDGTPLMLAAFMGRLEFARTLLRHGAKVDATDEYGNTALTLAQKNGHTEIVTLLRKAGAK